jgi:GTP cyclohydrolase I
VSAYLREIGTEGRYARRTRDKKLIVGLVGITQLCNEIADYPEIQEKLQREIDEIWQIL